MTKKLGLPSPPPLRASAAYACAVAAPIVTAALGYAMRPITYSEPFILFALAVSAAAWLGGVGAGLVATALSAVLGNVLFLAPYNRFSTTGEAIAATSVFVIVGAFLSLLNNSLQAGDRERHELALKELEASARARDAEKCSAEENFRLLVESVVDYAVYQIDPSGGVVTWNKGARRIKGYEAHEILGQSFSRFFTPEDLGRGEPQRLMERAVEEGRVESEGWRLRKDGSRFWANAVLTALRDGEGRLIGFVKVTRDLTERSALKKLLASIRRSRHTVNLPRSGA